MVSIDINKKPRLGAILTQIGACDSLALQSALRHALKGKKRLGKALVEMGMISETALVDALARQFNAKPLLSLKGHSLSAKANELFPLEKALQYMLFPCDIKPDSINLVTCDPANNKLFEEMTRLSGTRIAPYVSTFNLVMTAIASIYDFQGSANGMSGKRPTRSGSNSIPEVVKKAVMGHLVDSGRILVFENGRFVLIKGSIKAMHHGSTNAAWLLNAISITGDSAILICGENIPFRYDARRVRRRIEDTIRKKADSSEILQLALQLGVNID